MMGLREAIYLTLALAAFVFGLWLGCNHGRSLVAKLETDWAQERTTLAQNHSQALARVIEIERTGAELATQLAAAVTERARITQEKNHEISRLSSGRACFNAELVGVLNNSPTAHPDAAMPTPTRDAAHPPAAATADQAVATDIDLAHWIAFARDQYDTCRERVDALRFFYREQP